MAPSQADRYQVGAVGFSRINHENLIPSLEGFFATYPANNFVCISNVHTTVESGRDARLRGIQNGSFLTIADGQPIILHGKLGGTGSIERIMGPDIMTAVFSSPQCVARRHFFLGGAPGTLQAMEKNLRERFPHLIIAGMHSPPFRALSQGEEEDLKALVLAAAPDYLWVCFGAPKQEYWMEVHHRDFPKSLLIGIGAGFAYHAGELTRAPLWAQKLACEWLWRLKQDPKRLWKRYLKTNPVFLLMLAKAALARLFR